MPRILHFADAHIDIATYGKRDPESGLPIRVLDFLRSLDEIIDTAITEKVDCVVFAGDAYKDRNPSPTYQREWGQRIMRLSEAQIPTLLLVGNHDISPAVGRAHALAEFTTLQVPHVRILDQPVFLDKQDLTDLGPDDKELNMQLLALPWISRSEIAHQLELSTRDLDTLHPAYKEYLTNLLEGWLSSADPDLPTILVAHASVEGATFGGERAVSLGTDPLIPFNLVVDSRLDYVALGHIHKPQNLHPDQHPPVIYPGSIERVDFGEAAQEKFFIIAEIERGRTEFQWRPLSNLRNYLDISLVLDSKTDLTAGIIDQLPEQEVLRGSIFRLVLEYPRSWDPLIDENALEGYCEDAFEFHLVKQPRMEQRLRLSPDTAVGSLTPEELLNQYWEVSKTPKEEIEELNKLAADLFHPDQDPD